MLRPLAEKLYEITEEMWSKTNAENRELVEEYLTVNKQLSPKTKGVYTSAIRQFFWFVYEKLNDKVFYKISKRDFIKYMSYLQERGLSSSAINLRKSAVSSFCNYIENVVVDDVTEYKDFRNFTRGMPATAKNQVYNKVPITFDEYQILINELEKKKDYLGLAWVATAFNVGSRRAELIQFKTEILDYPIVENQNYIISHVVRGKGSSIDGKPLKYMIPLDVLKYMKLWVENRGHESDYIFTTKYGGKIKPISTNWANRFCKDILSPILGKRVHPHMFKASCITYLLERGKDLKLVSKYVAQHNDTATTSGFYDLRDFEEEKNNIFS
ncbi:MAG: site-specific integrase [Candidatus Pacebacteria bacterium]|nr:site-specific integrase [Candidatus Paceibacterota bacterium]